MIVLKADNRHLVDGARYGYTNQNYGSGINSMVLSNSAGMEADKFVLDVRHSQRRVLVCGTPGHTQVLYEYLADFAEKEGIDLIIVPQAGGACPGAHGESSCRKRSPPGQKSGSRLIASGPGSTPK